LGTDFIGVSMSGARRLPTTSTGAGDYRLVPRRNEGQVNPWSSSADC